MNKIIPTLVLLGLFGQIYPSCTGYDQTQCNTNAATCNISGVCDGVSTSVCTDLTTGADCVANTACGSTGTCANAATDCSTLFTDTKTCEINTGSFCQLSTSNTCAETASTCKDTSAIDCDTSTVCAYTLTSCANPTCASLTTSTDCNTFGCVWNSGACADPLPLCSTHKTTADCLANKLCTLAGACAATATTCASLNADQATCETSTSAVCKYTAGAPINTCSLAGTNTCAAADAKTCTTSNVCEYTYNGCNEPICSSFLTISACSGAGCNWWNNGTCSGASYVCIMHMTYSSCSGDTLCTPVGTCADGQAGCAQQNANQMACEMGTMGFCQWKSTPSVGTCALAIPSCSLIASNTVCDNSKVCGFTLGSCTQPVCSVLTTQSDCNNSGCSWTAGTCSAPFDCSTLDGKACSSNPNCKLSGSCGNNAPFAGCASADADTKTCETDTSSFCKLSTKILTCAAKTGNTCATESAKDCDATTVCAYTQTACTDPNDTACTKLKSSTTCGTGTGCAWNFSNCVDELAEEEALATEETITTEESITNEETITTEESITNEETITNEEAEETNTQVGANSKLIGAFLTVAIIMVGLIA